MQNDTPQQPVEYDVLVVGGGPAGTTAATLLHEQGHRVVVVEKDRHPRFHIGESLLPRNIPILRRLGVMEELSRIGVLKRAADFSMGGDASHTIFDFSKALAPDEPTAFQVKRADFDHMLLRNAQAKGVTVMEETTVTEVNWTADGVAASVRDAAGRITDLRARFIIDASGRDTFLSKRLNLKQRNPNHNSAAVFSHFDSVPRRPGEESGNISIYWFEHGWFWMIPLNDGRMSVGMVCWPKFLKERRGSLDEFFWQGVAMAPGVQERMREARAVNEITATGNFSYTSSAMTGDRFLLVGDAYAFIDPVFSSGVYLAMQGAEFAATAVDGCLREPARAERHLKTYERRVAGGLKQFSWFIYRFTSPAMRHLFRNPSDRFGLRAAVISVLSGDVYGRTRLWPQLTLFRAIYYTASLLLWRKGASYRRRLEDAPDTVT